MKGHAGFRSGRRNPFSPPSAVVVVVEDDTRFWHIRRTQYVHWREREKSFAFLAFPLPPLQLGSRHCQSGGFEQRNNERGKKFQILLYYLNVQYQIFIGVPISLSRHLRRLYTRTFISASTLACMGISLFSKFSYGSCLRNILSRSIAKRLFPPTPK